MPPIPANALTNPFQQRLRAGERLCGAWFMSGAPALAEAVGLTGCDYVVLDLEHSTAGVQDGFGLLQALAGGPAAAVVRMPDQDPAKIKQMLDFGALTLMFPFVETAAEAAALARACRYPPAGFRGFARMTRAARWGHDPTYPERANQAVMAIAQLETPRAIANAAEIGAVEGVDALFVGPGDLSAALGLIGQTGHERVRTLLGEAAQAARGLGKPIGTVMGSVEDARWAFEAGYSYVSVSSDIGMLLGAYRAAFERLRT